MFSLFSPFLTIFGYLWLIYDPIFDHFLGVNSSDVGSNVRQKHVKTLRDFFALFSPFSPFILPFLFVNLYGVFCVLPCSGGTAICFRYYHLFTHFYPFLSTFGLSGLYMTPFLGAFLSPVRRKHVRNFGDFFALFSPFSPFIPPFLFVNLIGVLCVLPCSFGTAIFFHFFNLWGIYPDPLLVAPFGGTFWGLPRARVGARARARGRARARCLALLVYIVFNMTQLVAYLGFIPLHWGVPPFRWGLVVSKKG